MNRCALLEVNQLGQWPMCGRIIGDLRKFCAILLSGLFVADCARTKTHQMLLVLGSVVIRARLWDKLASMVNQN